MLNTITLNAITCIMGVAIPAIMGYLLGIVKREKNQSRALICLLRSNITSKYYVYKQLGYVPRYEKENVNEMYAQYKSMKANHYVDTIIDDFNTLPIKEGLE